MTTNVSKYKAQIEDIINLSVKNIYQSKEVIQKEVVGHRAISSLLSYYTEASVRSFELKANTHDNLILSQDQSLEIKGVLDWEMATLGDPLMDLGTTLGYWIQESDPDFLKENNMNITLVKGNLTRSQVVEKYSKKSNIEMKNISFYYVYGLFKIAVIIQQIYYRYKNGYTTDIRFKNLNEAVEMYGKMGLQALQKNKIDNLY